MPQRPHHRVVPHIVEQRGAQQPATTCVYGVGRGQAVISAAPFVATTILAAELQSVMNFALSEKEGCGFAAERGAGARAGLLAVGVGEDRKGPSEPQTFDPLVAASPARQRHLGCRWSLRCLPLLLADRWFSPQVIGYCSREIDGEAARVRRLVRWPAAVHDVGKASPAFAVQDDLADAMRAHGLAADPRYKTDPQRTRVRHEMVGQQAVRVWLTEELGSTSGEQPLLWAV